MILSREPWLMRRAEIGAITRDYALTVLSHPVDDRGRPVFPEEEAALEGWAERRAVRMGMMADRAGGFAARHAARKGGKK